MTKIILCYILKRSLCYLTINFGQRMKKMKNVDNSDDVFGGNPKLQLFVRWDKSGFSMTGGGKVELQADGKVVFSSSY